MNKKRILLVGNHSCSNRGDAAISRGLIEGLEQLSTDLDVDFWSRYPKGASVILSRQVGSDETDQENSRLLRIIRHRLFRPLGLDLAVLLAIASYYFPFMTTLLPKQMKNTIVQFKQYEAIIQVGGSFFVDLYGLSQFRLFACALLAKRKIVLIGHSLGPFELGVYRWLANWLLKRSAYISIRDQDSIDLLEQQLPQLKFTPGADTAWLVNLSQHLYQPVSAGSAKAAENTSYPVAFTFRKLAPFDKRLGLSQSAYESEMAELATYLLERGYTLRFFSTCTSFDGYHNDDRQVAQRIKAKLPPHWQSQVTVEAEELTDVELGERLSHCRFLIGTRLHSSIIAMNFGIPAISIAYEHKATGLHQSMGLEKLAVSLSSDFSARQLHEPISELENNYAYWHELVQKQVKHQRKVALASIQQALEIIECF